MTQSGKALFLVAIVITAAVSFVAGRESVKAELRKTLADAFSSVTGVEAPIPGAQVPPSASVHSGWSIAETKSQMDDSPIVSLSLEASKPITAWPNEEHTPTLLIRCKERSTDLYINNGSAPNVEYGHTDEGEVRLRLDSAAAFTQYWGKSTSGEALFAPNPVALARRLAASRILTYRFTPYNSNPVTTTFELSGLDSLLPKVADPCGWGQKTESGRKRAQEDAADASAAARDSSERERLANASTDSTLPWVTSESAVYYYPNVRTCPAVNSVTDRSSLRYFKNEERARGYGRARAPTC